MHELHCCAVPEYYYRCQNFTSGLVILESTFCLATAMNTLPIGERGLTVETTGMAWFGFSIH